MVDRTTAVEPRPVLAPTPEDASRSLAQLGFLVRSDLPDRAGPAYLLVALREHPALTHYDPEAVEYWVTRDHVGRRQQLTRQTPLPIDEQPFSWGEIRIVDRLHVTNEYLTFGGSLSAGLVDGVEIAVFSSTVPLLRRGGHSQSWDEAAENVGAFFGRAKIAVDYVPASRPASTSSGRRRGMAHSWPTSSSATGPSRGFARRSRSCGRSSPPRSIAWSARTRRTCVTAGACSRRCVARNGHAAVRAVAGPGGRMRPDSAARRTVRRNPRPRVPPAGQWRSV